MNAPHTQPGHDDAGQPDHDVELAHQHAADNGARWPRTITTPGGSITHYPQPTTVALLATLDAELELDLDHDARWSYVRDVISVERTAADEIILTTCRTIEDPSRSEFVIAGRYVEQLEALR
jgi:hypothetical protein